MPEENKIVRFTYGLKSRINLGNYSSKEVVVEYVMDAPTPEGREDLKQKVLDEIIEEETKMRSLK